MEGADLASCITNKLVRSLVTSVCKSWMMITWLYDKVRWKILHFPYHAKQPRFKAFFFRCFDWIWYETDFTIVLPVKVAPDSYHVMPLRFFARSFTLISLCLWYSCSLSWWLFFWACHCIVFWNFCFNKDTCFSKTSKFPIIKVYGNNQCFAWEMPSTKKSGIRTQTIINPFPEQGFSYTVC